MEQKKKLAVFFGAVGAVLLALIVLLVVLLGQSCSQRIPSEPDGSGSSAGTSDLPDAPTVSDPSALPTDGDSDPDVTSDTPANGTTKAGDKTQTTTRQNSDTSGPAKTTASSGSAATTTKGAPKVDTTIDTAKYNLYTYTRPYWEGDTVYNESVYPMTTADGKNETITLLYPATKIVEVRSSDLKTVYKEGKDYQLVDGKLTIPAGSSIRVNKYGDYYYSSNAGKENNSVKTANGYMYFSEGPTFHNAQIAVTYRHSAKWSGPVPAKQGKSLPRLASTIADRGGLNIVFFGDSISCGANASSTVGASPMSPKWTDMFVQGLEAQGVTVTSYNTAVGGQVSSFGVTNVKARITRYTPDLVVLGFGMNDSSQWNSTSVTQYRDNIRATIVQIREQLPNCEIILLGSIVPNPEAVEFVGNGAIPQYTEELRKLADQYDGVVMANMTEIHKHILTRKSYRDITGNNVNHPNDFISRMYAQVLLRTVER